MRDQVDRELEAIDDELAQLREEYDYAEDECRRDRIRGLIKDLERETRAIKREASEEEHWRHEGEDRGWL